MPGPHGKLLSALLTRQHCLPPARSCRPWCSQRPCFLPPATLSRGSSKPLSPCPSPSPPSHPPGSPLFLISLLCRISCGWGGSGGMSDSWTRSEGPLGDLGMEHGRDPPGAGVSRAVECGEGWVPELGIRAGGLSGIGVAGPGQAALGAGTFLLQDWTFAPPFTSLFPVGNSGLGDPPPPHTQPSSLPSWQRPALRASRIPPDSSWNPDPKSHGCLCWALPASVTRLCASCSWGCSSYVSWV